MGGKTLVIVESPTKAKTIKKFLGKSYTVEASNGHVRDLPGKGDKIPEKNKKPWMKLGVDVENDFQPFYLVPESKKQHVKKLKSLLKDTDELLLATDEDREGESISWHLFDLLKPKVPVKRLVFHEITKEAIKKALENTREIDENLVRAQETRRIVDRLFGYEVSPLLWKKIKTGLSAGRVQSVVVRLLVEKERERIAFHTASYWTLKGAFDKQGKNTFEAELSHVSDKRVATGKDFDPATGKLKDKTKVTALSEKEVGELKKAILSSDIKVTSVEEKPYSSKPYPPFVTSTLQQEGNRKFRFSAKRTMQIAQQLYEHGFITYMRTDSTILSAQAIEAARSFIQKDYGNDYLPQKAREYITKVKNAQEAHEAIRPAGDHFTSPEEVKAALGVEAFKLYELIWKRTVASQMKDATGKRNSLVIEAGEAKFRASGKTIEFPGYLRAYVEGSDDPEAELADQEKILPKLTKGDKLNSKEITPLEKNTLPPARFTEGSIIKELETRGIGRPSTWASIVELILNRHYAFKKGPALVPTFTGMAVVGLLEKGFPKFVDYAFTARLEDDLDSISLGEAKNINYLNDFYFGNGHPGLKPLVDKGVEDIDPREVCGITLGKTQSGVELEVRIGRYGPFISDGENRASLADNIAPEELTVEKANELIEEAKKGPQTLGDDPQTNEPVYLKSGRFGPYVQLGESGTGKEKPKMASLLSNQTPDEIDLETALALLSLPRELGKYPENDELIVAANGRYGPYIKCGTDTRSLSLDTHSPLTITLEQAIVILKEPKKNARKGSSTKNLKELGNHPISEKPLVIKTGALWTIRN